MVDRSSNLESDTVALSIRYLDTSRDQSSTNLFHEATYVPRYSRDMYALRCA